MTIERRIADLIAEDGLTEAVALALDHVKTNPTAHAVRLLLIDLLILAGDLERADRQAGVAATLAPADAVGLSLLRRQLRGLFARDAWFAKGAAPSFPNGPTPCDRAAIRLGIALRDGDDADAKAALAALEDARGERPALWNDERVADLRDLDDRIPHALEAISAGGVYLWIDLGLVRAVTFDPVARPRDLALRRARLDLAEGSSADVLIPAIYPAGSEHKDALALGRETDWTDGPGGVAIGHGLRCFLTGDEMRSILEAESIAPERQMAASDV